MPEGCSLLSEALSCALDREVGTPTISVLLLANNLNKIDEVDVDRTNETVDSSRPLY